MGEIKTTQKRLNLYLIIEDFNRLYKFRQINSEQLKTSKCSNCFKRLNVRDIVQISASLTLESTNFYQNSIEAFFCQECFEKEIEVQFYLNVIDNFYDKSKNNRRFEREKYLYLIKLANKSSLNQGKNALKNALILLNSLNSSVAPDVLSNKGTDSRELSAKDKQKLNLILKSEFLNN